MIEGDGGLVIRQVGGTNAIHAHVNSYYRVINNHIKRRVGRVEWECVEKTMNDRRRATKKESLAHHRNVCPLYHCWRPLSLFFFPVKNKNNNNNNSNNNMILYVSCIYAITSVAVECRSICHGVTWNYSHRSLPVHTHTHIYAFKEYCFAIVVKQYSH